MPWGTRGAGRLAAETLRQLLEDAFAGVIAADEAEVLPGEAPGEVDLAGEEWTLRVEGWPERPVAWLALDDEPEAPAERRSAREAAMGGASEAALAALDARLDGALSAALAASGDPLSLDLAEAIRARAANC